MPGVTFKDDIEIDDGPVVCADDEPPIKPEKAEKERRFFPFFKKKKKVSAMFWESVASCKQTKHIKKTRFKSSCQFCRVKSKGISVSSCNTCTLVLHVLDNNTCI